MLKKIYLLALLITISFDSVYSQTVETANSSVDTVWLNLAFECCHCGKKDNKTGRQFSFCSDGIEQYYGDPIFVELDFDNFLDSYNKPVYLINQNNCLPHMEIERKYEEIQRIENLIDSKNTVSFYNRKFKRAINKRARKVHKSFANFDGKFSYGLFKVKMVRMPIGEVNKMLPNLDLSKKNVYIFDRKIFAYCIIDILSIEAIPKEEYLNIR